MPELPEVEIIKRGLSASLLGAKITQVKILNPKSFQADPRTILNQTIQTIWRRGKLLGIALSNQSTLLIHLKMSGQIVLASDTKPDAEPFVGGHPTKDMHQSMPNKSTRVIFYLQPKTKATPQRLYFNDQRKFGYIKLVKDQDLIKESFLQKLGPEPLEPGFTPQVVKSQLQKHPKTPIKATLLDQTVIAGIGNIYACEALFLAGIDPKRKTSTLSENDFASLTHAIIKALNLSLKHGGSSLRNYLSAAGEKGYFLDVAYVYNRQGKPCRNCQTKISKITLSGRGTYFCPHCQS